MGSHEGVGGVYPGSGKERSMGGERDRGGTGKAGEPVHDMDEKGMHNCKQGGPRGAPLLKSFPGEDTDIVSVNMEMDMLMEGAEEVNNVRRDVSPGQKGATVRELVREKIDCFRGEPLRRQLRGQVLQREGAAEEEITGD
eukprot:12918611-Prorocentrum_lima.AAC.1